MQPFRRGLAGILPTANVSLPKDPELTLNRTLNFFPLQLLYGLGPLQDSVTSDSQVWAQQLHPDVFNVGQDLQSLKGQDIRILTDSGGFPFWNWQEFPMTSLEHAS